MTSTGTLRAPDGTLLDAYARPLREVRFVWRLDGSGRQKVPLTKTLIRDATWQPAHIVDEDHGWMIRKAEAIRARVVPWVPLYVGPRLVVRGEQFMGFGGSLPSNPFAMVAMNYGTGAFLETVHHELWHAIEERLPADLRHLVDIFVEDSRELYGADLYRTDPFEARAHAYAKFACVMDALPGQLHVDKGAYTAAAVFAYVYSGDWAKDVMRKQRAQPENTGLQPPFPRQLTRCATLVFGFVPPLLQKWVTQTPHPSIT